jgi:hypothetical protein
MSVHPLPDPTPREWAHHIADSHRAMAKHHLAEGRTDVAMVHALLAIGAHLQVLEEGFEDVSVSIGSLA